MTATVKVIDSGLLDGAGHFKKLIKALSPQRVVIAKVQGLIDWWFLEFEGGEKVVYLGTKATFAKFLIEVDVTEAGKP